MIDWFGSIWSEKLNMSHEVTGVNLNDLHDHPSQPSRKLRSSYWTPRTLTVYFASIIGFTYLELALTNMRSLIPSAIGVLNKP